MKRWLLLLYLVATGCSPKIVSYVNERAKFGQFETYRLVSAKSESKNVTPENTTIFDLIKENIHQQMTRRGYQTSNVTPDLTLRYEVTSNTRVEINNNQVNPYFYQPFPVTTRTIYQSILLLELFDSNNKLVWQGSYDLKQEKKEKKVSKAINRAVGYIFTTYPYRALSGQEDESLKTIEK
ncbi:DUF4136 domain-containing protein [Ekhidna sp. MALMAid0563]|uniref:DUF4136 domain-containing protein n=1 Tax=Ekhidna sp. MALMAid0563 TaxID=3143937 RepID=UPI0032DEBCB6